MIKPFPKPSLPQPKAKRLPVRRRMTLIAGFRCHEGIVMLADMEEASGITSKRKVAKLRPVDYFGDWMTVMGGAGDPAIIDNATEDLATRLSSITSFDKTRVQLAIDETLKGVHDKYIDPDTRSEGMSLVIGITEKQGSHLYSTRRRTPQPQQEFVAVGYGEDLANYFADKLHSYWLSLDYVVKLASFIAKEVEESVLGCGQGSQLVVLPSKGSFTAYSARKIVAEMPSFEEVLLDFLQKLKTTNSSILQRSEDRQ
jgi:20S proteasome alpha/beta subunit